MADITKKSAEDLQKEIAEKREALRVFRFGGAGSRTRNVREGRNLRHEIARMLTELKARTIANSKKNG
ncbi:50S ribosomal protein L29 [bacterium]|nr:50S ribosomal protein L29 [bacterium]